MAVEPRLLNPTKVRVAQKNEQTTQYDHLRRTAINVVAKEAFFEVDAQIKWNITDGAQALPSVTPGGVDEQERGYMMVRTKDLEGLSKTLKRGDRILKIADRDVNFFILRIDPGSHYGGKFTLLRVTFGDRRGENG